VQAVKEGALRTTPVQRQVVAALYRQAMASTLQAERSLVEAVTVLQDAGAEYRAMDGVALAHLAYPDPGWRPFGSAALLVADRFAVEYVLTKAGWRTEQAEAGSDSADHTNLSGPGQTQLQLHDRLGYGSAGSAMISSCFEGVSLAFTVGGATVAALTPEQLLLRACHDAAFNIHGRLRACRDTCQLLAGLSVDVETTRRLSQGCRMEIVVGLALSAACVALALDEAKPEHSALGQGQAMAGVGIQGSLFPGSNGSAPGALSWHKAWSSTC
jgi:hypothetical protein